MRLYDDDDKGPSVDEKRDRLAEMMDYRQFHGQIADAAKAGLVSAEDPDLVGDTLLRRAAKALPCGPTSADLRIVGVRAVTLWDGDGDGYGDSGPVEYGPVAVLAGPVLLEDDRRGRLLLGFGDAGEWQYRWVEDMPT